MDLSNYKHVYFIGIGGISMSGLADILRFKKYDVSGSDMTKSDTTISLESKGITVHIGHKKENIAKNVDLIIYTAAVKKDNEEFIEGMNRNIKMIDRAELLGLIMEEYENSITISGTHGKTTTTSMISEILLEAGKDPTLTIGGILPSINSNIKIGGDEFFVAEACEYFDSFLKFKPYLAVILNIEADHLDYFKDLEHIYSSFKQFCMQIRNDGHLIINKDIEDVELLIEDVSCNVKTFSLYDKSADFYASEIDFTENGGSSFFINSKNVVLGEINLNLPGLHNISNALGAICSCITMGIDIEFIKKGLSNFEGTKRRFQRKGTFKNVIVVDDYAHHPTEIKATLNATKKMAHNKIWCIFQPHTYSRTKSLIDEFATSFTDADHVIIPDIYAAREQNTGLIHSQDLVNVINCHTKNAKYIADFDSICDFVIENCSAGDVLITMGAGDIFKLGEMIVSK